MSRKTSGWAAPTIMALMLVLTSGARAAEVQGEARVLEGDRLQIQDHRLRLFGIDAPEMEQSCMIGDSSYRCGERAALALTRKIADSPVRCEAAGADGAVCYVRGEELNHWMVLNGWAMADPRNAPRYMAQEQTARRWRIGLWRGDFEPPWQWRRQQQEEGRLAQSREATADGSRITLTFSGAANARFRGECSLTTAEGTEKLTIEGTVPETRHLTGNALRCRFAADGMLTIEVRKGGNVSRSSTSGGTVAISVS